MLKAWRLRVTRDFSRRSIGILGFGALGQYIYDAITSDEKFSRDLSVLRVEPDQ